MALLRDLDVAALARVIGLRYKLHWAKARSREGRTALAMVAALGVGVTAVLVSLGGVGAAAAALRAGRVNQVALAVLLTFYLLAIGASLILGTGLNAALSTAVLRRYPLSAGNRFAARHLSAFLDPLWFVCLALDVGVAVGFWRLGVTPLWLGVPAALLLVATNWLAARVVAGVAEWIVSTRIGSILLAALAISFMVLPPLMRTHPAWVRAMLLLLATTPPVAATRVIVNGVRLASLGWLAYLACWIAGLAWMLVGLDRIPARSRGQMGAAIAWGGPSDWVGDLFGPPLGPLVTKMLRYYVRSPQVRWNFPFVLPMLVTVWLGLAREQKGIDLLPYALGTLAAVGFLCTGAMSLNLFGFDEAGFRRYFLLPAPAGLAVRAAAIVAILPGAVLVTVALAAWVLVGPAPADGRMLVMLAASGYGGLLFLQALSLWVSVLSPRPAQFSHVFGNRLSPAGGAALCGGMAVVFGLPGLLFALGTPAVVRAWFVWPLFGLVSLAFYAFTHGVAPRVFVARRERMMAVIERTAAANWLMG